LVRGYELLEKVVRSQEESCLYLFIIRWEFRLCYSFPFLILRYSRYFGYFKHIGIVIVLYLFLTLVTDDFALDSFYLLNLIGHEQFIVVNDIRFADDFIVLESSLCQTASDVIGVAVAGEVACFH
jgi:hypothetical protein